MLTELHLSGKSETMRDSLAAVCLFPRLQTLGLDVSWGESGGRLDLAALQSLPALQKLSCNGWQRVELRGGTMLHQLTSLDLCRMEVFTTAAALPSLQKLRVCHGDVVELAGEHFQLPQLSQLELGYFKSADINWPALPQLAQLMVEHWSAPPAAGSALLSTLGRLARLYLRWSAKTWQAAAQLLQASPPSLRELYLDGSMVGWPKPPLYPWTAQLTSLSCTSPAIPPRLGNLAKLQRLDFPRHSAGDLALEDAKWLRGLTSLSQLCFDKQRGGMACAADHIQVRQQSLFATLPRALQDCYKLLVEAVPCPNICLDAGMEAFHAAQRIQAYIILTARFSKKKNPHC